MARVATHARPFRLVNLAAVGCGHRWAIRTTRTDDELAEERLVCPVCKRHKDGQIRRAYRQVEVLAGARICAECPQPLNQHSTGDLCGPCETRHQRKAAAMTEPQWRLFLRHQRGAVLSLLPGTFPQILVKAALMARSEPTDPTWRVRGVDVQQILAAAIRAGDVIQWNPDGRRPVYKLVEDLPQAEPTIDRRESPATDDELLALMPATAKEIAGALGYDGKGLGDRLLRMQRDGLCLRTGRGGLKDPYVYRRVGP